jgi:hypothetical protein
MSALDLPQASYIYAVQRADGLIKFGHTINLRRRFFKLRVEYGETLRPLGYLLGSLQQERALHEILGEARSYREWFKPTQFVLDVVGIMSFLPDDIGERRWSEKRIAAKAVKAPELLWGMLAGATA